MNFDCYRFSFGKHNNKNVIWVDFPFNHLLKDELKHTFPFAKWSQSQKSWFLPDNDAVRSQLGMDPKNIFPLSFIFFLPKINWHCKSLSCNWI